MVEIETVWITKPEIFYKHIKSKEIEFRGQVKRLAHQPPSHRSEPNHMYSNRGEPNHMDP